MRFYLCLIAILFNLQINAQKGNSCDNPKTVALSELTNYKPELPVEYLLVNVDSGIVQLNIAGNFDQIQFIFPKKDCLPPYKKPSLTFDSLKFIVPTQEQKEMGYCFCHYCSESWKKINLINTNSFILKVTGKNSKLTFKIYTPDDLREKEWFEKDYQPRDVIQLKNILFYPAKANFLRSSYDELQELLKLLKNKPNLKIEIQGHVNGPKQRNKDEFQELSEARAEAVYKFLIKNGIDKNRLAFKGFGNTKMVYPEAETEKEMELNRRVEIVITQ